MTADEVGSLRRAWGAFVDGNPAAAAARPEIVASWRRSQHSRVSVDHLSLPFTPIAIAESKLMMAATPVLDEFARRLAGSPVSVVLADRGGRVVGRWSGERQLERQLEAESISLGFVLTEQYAGTNGIGTALETMRPVKVHGPEHYVQALHGLTCAAAPLRNPLSRQIEGVVNLACPNDEVNALLLPTVIDLARHIGKEMHARSTHREQAVLEAFLLANRTIHGPIVAISETFLMANSAAAPLLGGAEHAPLWEQVPKSLGERALAGQIQLDHELRQATFRGVVVGGRTVGSIVELKPSGSIRRRAAPESLVAAEGRLRSAGLVGRGQAWRHLCAAALRTCTDRPLVILGETGVGKRTWAEFLHSERSHSELRVVPAGLEDIHGRRSWLRRLHRALVDPLVGTIVITNAQDLTPACARGVGELIDAATSMPFVIATMTTTNPAQARTMAALPAQLNASQTLTIPPLRERPTDILPIVNHVLRSTAMGSASGRLSADALTALTHYSWPGNVRELCAVVRDTLGQRPRSVLTSVDLPAALQSGVTAGLSRMDAIERETLRRALVEVNGNKSAAAIALGISRRTLHRRIQRYRLDDNGIF